jgi:hypothetical protein
MPVPSAQVASVGRRKKSAVPSGLFASAGVKRREQEDAQQSEKELADKRIALAFAGGFRGPRGAGIAERAGMAGSESELLCGGHSVGEPARMARSEPEQRLGEVRGGRRLRHAPRDAARLYARERRPDRGRPRGAAGSLRATRSNSSAGSLTRSASRTSWPPASTGTTPQSVQASHSLSSSWAAEPSWSPARPVASRPPKSNTTLRERKRASGPLTTAPARNAYPACETSPPTSGKTLARFERRFELAAINSRRGRISEAMSVPFGLGHRNLLARRIEPCPPEQVCDNLIVFPAQCRAATSRRRRRS